MSRPVRRSDLAQVAVDARQTGELMLTECRCSSGVHRWLTRPDNLAPDELPCDCRNGRIIDKAGRIAPCPTCWVTCNPQTCPLCKPHTLAEHVWRSTRAMGPGPRAANTDPDGRGGWRYDDDGEPVPGNDPAGESATLTDPSSRLHDELVAALTEFRDADRRLHDLLQQVRPDRTPHLGTPSSDEDWCRHHLEVLGTLEPRYRGDECRTCYDFRLAHGIRPPKVLLDAKHEGRRWNAPMIEDAVRRAKLAQPKARKRKARRGKAS